MCKGTRAITCTHVRLAIFSRIKYTPNYVTCLHYKRLAAALRTSQIKNKLKAKKIAIDFDRRRFKTNN